MGIIVSGTGNQDDILLRARGGPIGYDTLVGLESDDTLGVDFGVSGVIIGGAGNDQITGGVPGTVVSAFGGRDNDTLVGFGGFFFASGNLGNDSIFGADVFESLRGGKDDDTVVGNYGTDTIYGDNGNDLLIGESALFNADVIDPGDDDDIFGNQGSDTIFGGSGADSMRGGEGNDYIDVAPVILGSAFAAFASFNYSNGFDTMYGDNGSDTIGRSEAVGDKDIFGDDGAGGTSGGAADSLVGGHGDDDIFGEAGNDTIRGGDTFNALLGPNRDFIDGGAGDDSINGGPEAGAFAGVLTGGDTILGGVGNDNIQGDSGNDSIEGGLGNDSVEGGGDNDTLLGNDQSDTLRGGEGADSIIGGNDADRIEGGLGSDTLIGFVPGQVGDGVDRFEYNLGNLLNVGTFTPGAADTGSGELILPNGTTQLEGLPEAVDQTAADYIRNFDVANDIIEIRSAVFAINTLTAGPGPDNIPGNADDVPFGSSVTASTPFGAGIFASTPSGTLGSVSATAVTADGVASALVFIERNATAGYQTGIDGDIAIATLIGVAPASLTSANFQLI